MTGPLRLAIVATHPIQHFVPLYRELAAAAALDVKVFYASKVGLSRYFDKEMGTEIAWKMDLTSGYAHEFLPEADRIERTSFTKINNPSVGSALSEFSPQVLMVYGYANLTTLYAIAWGKAHGVPILMVSDSELLQTRSEFKAILKKVALTGLARCISGILSVGDQNERHWAAMGVPPNRMFRSPFTIDEIAYRQARAEKAGLRKAWREHLGIGENDIVFLAVGKLSGRKRHADLLAALGKLKASCDAPVRLVLAGEGAERQALQTWAEKDGLPVIFAGFVNVDQLPAVYAACDVLVHPSMKDPHPLVFSEAACIGLPIISSDRVGAVGPTDIARPGENVIVFPVGDVQAIARAMMSLATNPEELERMGANSIMIFETQCMSVSLAGAMTAAVAVTENR